MAGRDEINMRGTGTAETMIWLCYVKSPGSSH